MFGEILKSADLLMKWNSNKRKKDKYVYEYVLEIANQADELALLWTELLSEFIENNEIDLTAHPLAARFVNKPQGWEYRNDFTYTRIEEFYNRLHVVLGDFDMKKADLLLEKLARLMEARNLSRSELSKTMGFEALDRDKIIELIHLINKQAAEIRGFAFELRARGR
ncbi:MAG: hypothetical protein AAGI09_11785 [Pseudomonadota bacterium]